MTRPEAARGASMLLSVRVQNVRSFREEAEFSMLATGLAETDVIRQIHWRDGGQPIGVLPVAGVFGANASGKSNLLKAMSDMETLVRASFRRRSPTGGTWRRPFLLDPACRAEPSRFEIDLVLEGVRHDYGFAVDDERVVEEWAFHYPKGRAATIFERKLNDVELGPVARAQGRAIAELLRPNALFLSTAAALNHKVLLPLFAWFERNLLLADADTRTRRQSITMSMLDTPEWRELALEMLRAADLGISGAVIQELDPTTRERMRLVRRVLAEGLPDEYDDLEFDQPPIHLVHEGAGGGVELDIEDESLGTLVWLGLVGPVLDVLARGSVLLADELDASLHPALVSEIVRLFQDPETNPRRAQLIFNSHDTTLLGDSVHDRLLGRDQIWFTEKRHGGSTRLYPLSDLDPRKEEAVGRRYLAGRYGATPILSRGQFASTAKLVTVQE